LSFVCFDSFVCLGRQVMQIKTYYKLALGTLVLCLLVVWQHTFILESYAGFFRKDNASSGADAIVVLSSPKFARLKHGLELSQKNDVAIVLVTTTPTPSTNIVIGLRYPTKMEWVHAVANHLEVETPVQLLPSLKDGARSTFDEAYDALAWSQEHGYKRIIIVTNAFHSRRAHYAFEKVFAKSGIEVQIGAAQDPLFSARDWWLSDSGLAAYLTEPLKFVAYVVFDHSPTFIRNY